MAKKRRPKRSSQVPPAPSQADASASGEPAKPSVLHRILVVDDDPDAADSLAMLLRLVGHDVRTANDGRQALVVAAAYRPELILLDIGLPRMDGFTVARHLRAQPELAGAVLVALTGYGAEEFRQQSLAAGFNHHLLKPVGLETLEALLRELDKTKK